MITQQQLARFTEDLKYIDPSLAKFKYAVVMPAAGRNLESIFRFERPSTTDIKKHAREVAEAISLIHEANIIHGDIKLMNVVR